jgi:hypothetical protein
MSLRPVFLTSLFGILLAITLAFFVPRASELYAGSPHEPLSMTAAGPRYDIGNPTLADVWVDVVNGLDTNGGASPTDAFKTLRAAWLSLPMTPTTTGYRIRLLPGSYTGAYLEDRHGAYQYPILIEPANGAGTVTFAPSGPDGGNITVFNSHYVYLQDFRITVMGGDGFQCERCDHLLLRRMTFSGPRDNSQSERIKLNQSQYIYIEDSDSSGAGDNALDAVAVQYGHIVGSRFHNANDWCLYLKGGSAYFRIEGNQFYDCGTGGFTAGQGTGFQFMTPPWLHYETYDAKFVNNLVHDTEGACFGVNGGFNILIAYNTCYRVGQRSHVVEVVHGGRGCDGGAVAACQPYLDLGGWGALDDGGQFIPNRNIHIYNNLIYNPPGYQSQYQHFDIRGAVTPPTNTNVPNPAYGDDNLQIRGNLIWNGPDNHPLGVDGVSGGCLGSNPTCSPAQLLADNTINTTQPQLVSPECGDYRPVTASAAFTITAYALSNVTWNPGVTPTVPTGVLTNTVTTDYNGITRTALSPVGAHFTSASFAACYRQYLPLILR